MSCWRFIHDSVYKVTTSKQQQQLVLGAYLHLSILLKSHIPYRYIAVHVWADSMTVVSKNELYHLGPLNAKQHWSHLILMPGVWCHYCSPTTFIESSNSDNGCNIVLLSGEVINEATPKIIGEDCFNAILYHIITSTTPTKILVFHMKMVILLRHFLGPIAHLAHMATRLRTGLACFVLLSEVDMQSTALSKHGIFLSTQRNVLGAANHLKLRVWSE